MKPEKFVALSMLILSIVLMGLMVFGVHQGIQAVGPIDDPFQKLSSAVDWVVNTYPFFWLILPFAMIVPAIFFRHSSALSQ